MKSSEVQTLVALHMRGIIIYTANCGQGYEYTLLVVSTPVGRGESDRG